MGIISQLYEYILTAVRSLIQILHHTVPQQIYLLNFTFIFCLLCREYIVHISSDWKFSIGIPARKVWKEKVHDFRQRPQYFRMDIAVLHSLRGFTLRVHRADGLEHRIQRSPDTVVRRRNNRTETQGVDGFVGVHLVYAWNIVDLFFGIFIRMEDRRIAECTLPDHVYMPSDFGTYLCLSYASMNKSFSFFFTQLLRILIFRLRLMHC